MKTRSKSTRKEHPDQDHQEERSSKKQKPAETLMSVSIPPFNYKEEFQFLQSKYDELISKEQDLEVKLNDVIEERDYLRREKEKDHRDRQIIEGMHVNQDDVFVINCGGVLMTTTRATLVSERESMLSAMFSGNYTLARDQNGHVFIDRNPKVLYDEIFE